MRAGGRPVAGGVCDSVIEAIGATPLVALRRLGEGLGRVLGWLENLNPGAA